MKKLLVVLAMICLMAVGVSAGIVTYTEDFSDCSEWNYIPNLNWTGSPTSAVNCSNGTLKCTDSFCTHGTGGNYVILTNNISFNGNYPVNISVDFVATSVSGLGTSILFLKDTGSTFNNAFGYPTSEFVSCMFDDTTQMFDNKDPLFEWYSVCDYILNISEWYRASFVIDIENYNLTTYIDGVNVCSLHIPINLSGIDYFALTTGNDSSHYVEYDNLVVITGSCVPDWDCSLYGDCNASDLRPCIEATDNNSCGLNYTGNYSEFTPQSCDYCTPSWSCTRHQSICPPDHTKFCIQVTDANGCFLQTALPSDDFDGNYSAYEISCGYNAIYGTEDLREESIDAISIATIEILHWMKIIMIFVVFGALGFEGIKRWIAKLKK